MSYADTTEVHTARIKGLFALYNARRFDEMVQHYCDDVVCYLPTVCDPAHPEMQMSHGKDAFRQNLENFYDLFGKLTVVGVFATQHSSSVMVVDEHDNPGTFSFEVTSERLVKAVIFYHQPGRNAAPRASSS